MYDNIEIVLNDSFVMESRLVIVSGEDNKLRAYISQDGEKLFGCGGKNILEIMKTLEFMCKARVGD